MPIPFFIPNDSAKTGLVAQSTDETKSPEIPLNNATQVSGNLQWGTGCSAGKVVFELAPSAGYAGVWEVIFSSDFVADSVATAFGTPPCTQGFTYPGPFAGFGRWRIADAVVGGTVTSSTQMLAGL